MSEVKEDEVAKFHALEQEGLQRAEGANSKPTGDAVWFDKIQDATSVMGKRSRDLGESEWATMAYQLNNAADYGESDARSCQLSGEARKECVVKWSTQEQLESVDHRYADIPSDQKPPPVTKRCTHLVGVQSPYTYPTLINDVTACFHRSLEHYEESARTWHKEGKCMWRE